MSEFYIIFARKIFFPNFMGLRAPTPRLLRLCNIVIFRFTFGRTRPTCLTRAGPANANTIRCR